MALESSQDLKIRDERGVVFVERVGGECLVGVVDGIGNESTQTRCLAENDERQASCLGNRGYLPHAFLYFSCVHCVA